MPLPVFDSERALVSARTAPLSESKAPAPAAGRPAHPDIDLVPQSDRMPSERTVVMPNAPGRPMPAPAQEHTVAMPRSHETPSARPVAFGPTAFPLQHGSRPPPNVRTRPLSFPPPAKALLPGGQATSVAPAHEQAPGVLGLVLFAAPLAFATMAVAALALL